jgi:predicted amidohydrolase
MKVGYYQFQPLFGALDANLEKILSPLNDAQADLIVLPELPFTGYIFQDRAELERLAEDPHSSPRIEALVALCRERHLYLVTGFAEKSGGKIYNSALLLGPSGLIATYRKLHLFDREKLYFDSGDRPLGVTTVAGAKVGLMVCFDWIFPEVCRILALEGAELICHPSNLVLNYCQQSMLTRCLENGIFAVTTNRCGGESRPFASLEFTGQSQIVAPKGDLLHRASTDAEELFIADIDLSLSHDKLMTPRNHLITDRRPEWYDRICRKGQQ